MLKKVLLLLLAILAFSSSTLTAFAEEVTTMQVELEEYEVMPLSSYSQTVTKQSSFQYMSKSYTLTGKYTISVDGNTGYLYSAKLSSWSSNISGLPYTSCSVTSTKRINDYQLKLTIKVYVMSILGNVLDSDYISVTITSPGPK